MGALPRHSARTREEFETWLAAIRRDLDAYAGEYPGAKIGPLAVNPSARQPAAETRADLEICARYGVKIIISALGNPAERNAQCCQDQRGGNTGPVFTRRAIEHQWQIAGGEMLKQGARREKAVPRSNSPGRNARTASN